MKESKKTLVHYSGIILTSFRNIKASLRHVSGYSGFSGPLHILSHREYLLLSLSQEPLTGITGIME